MYESVHYCECREGDQIQRGRNSGGPPGSQGLPVAGRESSLDDYNWLVLSRLRENVSVMPSQ